MEVLLRHDVPSLGSMGDVVEVADGYARNYLLPKKMAMPVTGANRMTMGKAREARRHREMAEVERLQDWGKKLEGFLCYIPVRATEKGHLFGSVGPEHIAASLTESGFEAVRPTSISLMRHIEEIGDYDIEVMLHPEVRVNIKVRVAPIVEEEQEQQ